MAIPIPIPPTTLFGREADVDAVTRLVTRGVRLVTLTGLGGVGKTRVALAVVQGLAASTTRWDVAYCDAVAVQSAPELAMAIANALELDVAARGRGDPLERVASSLASADVDHPLVLVLDNLEHLAALVGPALVGFVARLPRLRLIVTSRVSLGLAEEMVVPIAPIDASSADSPAVRLLLERARMTSPLTTWADDPEQRGILVALARRLDGLPLALELAAARAHLVTPAAMIALIDARLSLSLPGRGPRHGSREAAVAWSWTTLDPSARTALARLAVIEGSFDLDLARAALEVPTIEALDVVDVLVHHSLLVVERRGAAVRYRVLETVRDYVLTQSQSDPALLERARHALGEGLLGRIEPQLTRISRFVPLSVLPIVAAELERYVALVRAGLTATSPTTIAQALRAAPALLFAILRWGLGAETVERVLTILARPEAEAVPIDIRVGAGLRALAAGSSLSTSSPEVDALARQLERWAIESGDPIMQTHIASMVAAFHSYHWRFREAIVLLEPLASSPHLESDPLLGAQVVMMLVLARRAVGLARWPEDNQRLVALSARIAAIGRPDIVAIVDTNRAFLALQLGHAAEAMVLVESAVRDERQAGLAVGAAITWREVARAELDLGHRSRATAHFTEVLAALEPVRGSREWTETCLDAAAAELEAGEHGAARRLLDDARGSLSTPFDLAYHAGLEHALAALRGEPRPTPIDLVSHTVEDDAVRALVAIGTDGADAALAATERSAPHGFRVRLARRLLGATIELGNEPVHAPTTLALSLDDRAFRLGADWADLTAKPLIHRLLVVLAHARLGDVQAPVDKETLGVILWPDERLGAESRDARLHSAISTLRKEAGMQDAIVAAEGGFRLAPELVVVRVDVAAWPGPSGEVKKARGRGRPRKS